MAELTGVEVVELLVTDLEDTRQVLAACLTYFTAQDVAKAQTVFGRMRQSPIAGEIERVKERLDGVFGDYLLVRYEDEKGDLDLDDEEAEETVAEELVAEPLGAFVRPRQVGRRLDGIVDEKA